VADDNHEVWKRFENKSKMKTAQRDKPQLGDIVVEWRGSKSR